MAPLSLTVFFFDLRELVLATDPRRLRFSPDSFSTRGLVATSRSSSICSRAFNVGRMERLLEALVDSIVMMVEGEGE